MNEDDLQTFVDKGECETVEFKKTTGQLRVGMKTLCSMLNGIGGSVIFGIDDNGEIIGQQVSQRTLDDIHHEFKSFEPVAFPSVERIQLNANQAVIIVRVPGGGGPYTYDGRPYVRNGSTTTLMPKVAYERKLLERMHSYNRWEISEAVGIEITDLDDVEISRTIDEAVRRGRLEEIGTRDPLRVLEGLKLVNRGKLTNAAAVLFSKPDKLPIYYPQCLLRMARFKGTDKSEFIDSQQVYGNVFQLLSRAQLFLHTHVPVTGRILPNQIDRQDDPLYPMEALREAMANAFCHRDYAISGGAVNLAIYDNRLEITSTGILPFGITTEQLYGEHTSQPWNPLIAGVLYIRGFIENWGRGTLKMIELSKKAGLPSPSIKCEHNEVTVQFYPAMYTAPQQISHDLSPLQREILEVLAQGPAPLTSILASLQNENVAKRTVQENLTLLKQWNLVKLIGYSKNAQWQLEQ